MGSLAKGRARVVRGLAMSGACLLIPTVAHVAAGGSAPTNVGFFLAGALLSVASVALADRRRCAAEIGGLLLLSQPVLHVLLVIGGHHGSETALLPGLPMVLAHLAAAAVLTVLLAGVEAVSWSLATLAATVLLTRARRLLAAPRLVRGAVPSRRERGDVVRAHVIHLVRSTPWRGPPVPAGI